MSDEELKTFIETLEPGETFIVEDAPATQCKISAAVNAMNKTNWLDRLIFKIRHIFRFSYVFNLFK